MAKPLIAIEQEKVDLYTPDETLVVYFAAEKFDKVWKKGPSG